MICVIKNSKVFAIHTDEQVAEIRNKYSGLDIIHVADDTNVTLGGTDPRDSGATWKDARLLLNSLELDSPFRIKSAFYTSGTDTLSIVIASGTGETFNNTTINTITKTTDTTLNIPSPLASTTYTIYLKNDGNFDKSTDGTTVTGSITIGTVSTNADKSVNTIVDKRPLVSGVGEEFRKHSADKAHMINIKKYGAKCDGVADDTQAILDTITASEIGDIIFVPATCLVSDRIQGFKDYTKLQFAPGAYFKATATFKTTASQTEDSKYAIVDLTRNDQGGSLKHFSMENVQAAGTNDPTIDYGFYAKGIHRNFQFKNCVAINVTNGWYIECMFVSTMNRCEGLACSNDGFYIGSGSTSTKLLSCYASTCDRGYDINGVVYSSLDNCASDLCRIAYKVSLSSIDLNGCGCEGCDIPLHFSSVTGVINGGIYQATDNPITPVANLITIVERSYITLKNIVLLDGAGVTGKKVLVVGATDDSKIIVSGCKGFTKADISLNDQVILEDEVRAYSFSASGGSNMFMGIPVSSNPNEAKLVEGGLYYNSTSKKIRTCNATRWSDIPKLVGYGVTAERPTGGLVAGDLYIDTTLNKIIWYNNSLGVWKDAMGATV